MSSLSTDQTRRFFERLFRTKLEEHFIQVWSIPAKRSVYCATIDEAVAAVEGVKKAEDVYAAPGLAPSALSPSSRCPSDKIAGIPGVWADIDVKHNVHQVAALPPTLNAALEILPGDLRPSILVSTGHGLHAYWLLKEVWSFDSQEEREQAATLVARWQALLRRRAAAKGWTLDHTHDLARVLRVPGTANLKRPEAISIVQFYGESESLYTVSDLQDALDDAAIPRTLGKPATMIGTDRFTLSADVAVDPEILTALCEVDVRFRATWQRQRWDLHNGDPSQSHYDLAIANFCLDHGLGEQLAVDLMIQHRREGGKPAKLRPDYYARTISRAYAKGAGSSPVQILPQFPIVAEPSVTEQVKAEIAVGASPSVEVGGAIPEASPIALRPAGAPGGADKETPGGDKRAQTQLSDDDVRGAQVEEASRLLGIRILRVVKITGKAPTYVLELENEKIEIPNVGALMSQGKMREAIAASTNRVIRKFKTRDWDGFVELILASLTEQDGGNDLTLEGEIVDHLHQYLSETRFLTDTKGQTATAQRRPIIIDGQVAVMARDLEMWLRKSYGQMVSVKQISTALVAVGAVHYRYRRGYLEQSRWLLPTHNFPLSRWVAEEMRDEEQTA